MCTKKAFPEMEVGQPENRAVRRCDAFRSQPFTPNQNSRRLPSCSLASWLLPPFHSGVEAAETRDVLIAASRRGRICLVERKERGGVGRNKRTGGGETRKRARQGGGAGWEDLMNAAGVSWSSRPTRGGRRIDPRPPTCLPVAPINREFLLQWPPCWWWM